MGFCSLQHVGHAGCVWKVEASASGKSLLPFGCQDCSERWWHVPCCSNPSCRRKSRM